MVQNNSFLRFKIHKNILVHVIILRNESRCLSLIEWNHEDLVLCYRVSPPPAETVFLPDAGN